MSHRRLHDFESLWDLVTGCTVIGPGCDSCPAMAGNGFRREPNEIVYMHSDQLKMPSDEKEPRIFYVAMGSDLFHDTVTDDFIRDAFEIMQKNERHQFEVITKRSDRLRHLGPTLTWPKNVHVGVTVASVSCKHRISALQSFKSQGKKFLSVCPLLEDLGELDLTGIDAVGVVEESWGPCRKADTEWIDNIKRQCDHQGVEFVFGPAVISEEI